MSKPLTEFEAWPKIPRMGAVSLGIRITEKLSGRNATGKDYGRQQGKKEVVQ